MNRTRMFATLVLAAGVVAVASRARADDTGASGGGAAAGLTTAASASEHMDAAAKARLEAIKQRILDRSAKVSVQSRTHAEEQMEISAKEVDAHASGAGESKVAERLGKEFDMTSEAVTAEKTALNASWGDLTIAHALAANATSGTNVSDLVMLHQDGMGWGQIAAGLGLKLGAVVSGMKAESQVARGLAKADGHATAALRGGAGARADAGTKIGAGAAVGKGVSAGAAAGVNAGVKVGGKIRP
jgi:hypothetical protein